MSLRRKVLVMSAIIFVVAIALFFILSQTIIMRSFSRLETREMRQNLNRVTAALNEEIAALDTTTFDWSGWDDTHQFVVDHNQEYIDANLADQTWFVLGVNIALFVDRQGDIVFGRAVDLIDQEEVPIPESLLDHLQRGVLLKHDDPTSQLDGWINLPEGLLMLVSRPIITTEYQGPVNGTLIFARFVTPDRVEALSQLVHLDVSLLEPADPNLPAGLHIAPDAASGSIAFMKPINNEQFTGYTVLYDIYGQPAQVVRVETPRSIYQQGLSSLYYLFAAIAAVTLAFTAVLLFALNRGILVPLSTMGSAIRRIRTTNDISVRVPVNRQDEIGQLGVGFNDLLDALAQTQHALETARDDLEVRVHERTAQLEESNQQLQAEIIERQRVQQEVVVARDQALDALRVKSQILANVSHDARTPLSVIVLRTQLLQKRLEAALGDKERQMFEAVLSSAYQITRFVENLLSEARASNHKIELNYAPFDPVAFLNETKCIMGVMAERKGLAFITDVTERVPPRLTSDTGHLKQMILNLTENAIKFTDSGSITVCIDCPDAVHWSLQVADTGAGIPAAAQKHIFDAFYQADGTLTRDVNRGVGLGLSIVKGLATLMNADIGFQSEVGQGTTFTVTFLMEPQKQMEADHG